MTEEAYDLSTLDGATDDADSSDPIRYSVLVVDDSMRTLLGVRRLLGLHDYDVSLATSGREAIRRARSSPPDVVLMDCRMPDMDGFEACSALKEESELRDVPVLFVSGSGDPGDRQAAFRVGAADFVVKPYDPVRLAEQIRALAQVHRSKASGVLPGDMPPPAQQATSPRAPATEPARGSPLRTPVPWPALPENQNRSETADAPSSALANEISHRVRRPLQSLVRDLAALAADAGEFMDVDTLARFQAATRHGARVCRSLDQVLEMSQTEGSLQPLNRTDCDIRHVVDSAVTRAWSIAGERSLEWDPPEKPISACCDAAQIERAVSQMLEACIDLSAPGATIFLGVTEDSQHTIVSICEHTVLVSPAVKKQLLEAPPSAQFSSGAKRPGPRSLQLAQQIVEGHGGRFGISSAVVGVRLWFALPRSEG